MNCLIKYLFVILLLAEVNPLVSQEVKNETRAWWNVLYYDLSITPDYSERSLSGTNQLKFEVLKNGSSMQIDLLEPMTITRVLWNGTDLPFTRKGSEYLVIFPKELEKGSVETVVIHFQGHPQVAPTPPYTSGWIWAKDDKERPWMSVACEGSGAAIWFPCKNILSDEPDNGASLHITVPDTLVAVANGRLQKRTINKNGTVTWHWAVVNTINHYNIIPYIGKYVNWHENYAGKKGNLDCDYWVLDYNLAKAQRQFKQVDTMLQCFEDWLGPYPFYEDGYKLVESPHAGMEHQSGIAYGNRFMNGFRGRDVSGSGWGLKWDFIMVHESGHEWFGNSITAAGNGDSWIHEGFTKYLETVYTNRISGKEAGDEYMLGIRKKIKNDYPIVNHGTDDYYNKAATILHMIRQITGDDVFRQLLQGLNKTFYHRNVSSQQVFDYINSSAKQDLSKLFDQYFRTVQIPVLEYSIKDNEFVYRWTNCIKGFTMPLKLYITDNNPRFIYPTEQWQKLGILKNKPPVIDTNFYIDIKPLP